ncbi:MAG: hypothetical protein D6725_12700 [Planctomycetota bacterium]|nr:MAG: hypothetical protein D6725_12700 [Planctomycetota bacterium]
MTSADTPRHRFNRTDRTHHRGSKRRGGDGQTNPPGTAGPVAEPTLPATPSVGFGGRTAAAGGPPRRAPHRRAAVGYTAAEKRFIELF